MLLVLMLLPVVWTAAPTSVIRSGMATAVHSTTIDVNLKLLPCFLSDLEKRLKNWPLIKGILIIHSFVIEHLNISFVLEEMSNVLGVIRQNDNVLRRHLFCLFLLFSCFVCYLSWMMFLSAIFRISFLSHFSSSFLADSERARVFSLLPRDDIKKIRRSKRCVCKK